jgi:Spy/CpxP family protein refolding chaperone
MKLTRIALATVLMLAASVAVADRHRGAGELGRRFAQKLELTDAQREQIREIRRSTREQHRAFFQSSRETYARLRDARKAGDQSKVDALRPIVQENSAKMRQIREAETQQIRALLTPEQRERWDTLRSERRARRFDRQR